MYGHKVYVETTISKHTCTISKRLAQVLTWKNSNMMWGK